MKFLMCFLLAAIALSVASAGYIRSGWSGGYSGGYGTGYGLGGYGGWGGYSSPVLYSSGYGGWNRGGWW